MVLGVFAFLGGLADVGFGEPWVSWKWTENFRRGVVPAAEAVARRPRPRPVARRSPPRSSQASLAEAAPMKPAQVGAATPGPSAALPQPRALQPGWGGARPAPYSRAGGAGAEGAQAWSPGSTRTVGRGRGLSRQVLLSRDQGRGDRDSCVCGEQRARRSVACSGGVGSRGPRKVARGRGWEGCGGDLQKNMYLFIR